MIVIEFGPINNDNLGLQHGPGHHYRHRRRNSWTVTRKPSQVNYQILIIIIIKLETQV